METAEQMLQDRWTAVRIQALQELREADYNLYKIAIIYSGQLTLEQYQNDIHPYPYDVLDDPRSVAHGNDW